MGYLINRAASAKLAQNRIIDFLADWPLESRKIKFFAVHPPLVHHSKCVDSSIDEISAHSRKIADALRDGLITRLARIRSWRDAVLVWHFVFKRALFFYVHCSNS